MAEAESIWILMRDRPTATMPLSLVDQVRVFRDESCRVACSRAAMGAGFTIIHSGRMSGLEVPTEGRLFSGTAQLRSKSAKISSC